MLCGPSGQGQGGQSLDGRNRWIVIAEPLARVIAETLVTTCVGSQISPPQKNTEVGPHRPIRLAFVPHGIAEWPAKVDRVRCTLAIGDWQLATFPIRKGRKLLGRDCRHPCNPLLVHLLVCALSNEHPV